MNWKKRILIVDDQPAVLMLMVYLLTSAECEVVAAKNGTEAIRHAQKEEFDLVITDIDAPGINGFEICAYLKQDFRFVRTPVIFISDHYWEEDRRRSLEFGAADYIKKPLDGAIFAKRVLAHIK